MEKTDDGKHAAVDYLLGVQYLNHEQYIAVG